MVARESRFKRELRARAHHLEPVVQIGAAGLSDTVTRELARALHSHELIKVRLAPGPRQERASVIDRLCAETGAMLVQSIGRIAVLYRRREEEQ